MRMWLANPKLLCNQHLLGEHAEMHMFAGCINKNKNLYGYIWGGLFDVSKLKRRHDELADEIEGRGFNHKSRLPKFDAFGYKIRPVDIAANLKELAWRCPDCRERIAKGAIILPYPIPKSRLKSILARSSAIVERGIRCQ